MSRLNCVSPSVPSPNTLCAAALLSPPCQTSAGRAGHPCATASPDFTRPLGSPVVACVPTGQPRAVPPRGEPGSWAGSGIHPSIPHRPRGCGTGRCGDSGDGPWGGRRTGRGKHREKGTPTPTPTPTRPRHRPRSPAAGGSRRPPRSCPGPARRSGHREQRGPRAVSDPPCAARVRCGAGCSGRGAGPGRTHLRRHHGAARPLLPRPRKRRGRSARP